MIRHRQNSTAIAAEVKHHKANLAKQREEYVSKSAKLQRELEALRQQCEEIGKEGGRENNRIVKENQKLQVIYKTNAKKWSFYKWFVNICLCFCFTGWNSGENGNNVQSDRHVDWDDWR